MTASGNMTTTTPRRLSAAILAAALLALGGCAIAPPQTSAPLAGSCDVPGTWYDLGTAAPVAAEQLVAAMAARPVVLLGEEHDNAEHHRWQLQMLAALHGRKSDMAIGFESFPRRVQPVLDRWVAGELDVAAFLEAAEWQTVWAFDPSLYLPLFHFARQNRIPMVALNVDRALVARVSHDGWAAIPAEERAGLSDPAPASPAYRESLARIWLVKQALAAGEEPETEIEETDIAAALETEEFGRFVEAQLTWDRAMAEALAGARRNRPGALVVGILGRGHVEHRYGVPHQLADLGIPDGAVLLPVDRLPDCADLPSDLADAVFVVEEPEVVEKPRPRARLGIFIETTEDGVRVSQVVEDSVAAATGIEAGDIVVSAAGFPIEKVGELIKVVQRQAPGTWLPLTIRRGESEIELVARFSTSFGVPE